MKKPLHQKGSIELNDGFRGQGSKRRARENLAKGIWILQNDPRYNSLTKQDMYSIITQYGDIAGTLFVKHEDQKNPSISFYNNHLFNFAGSMAITIITYGSFLVSMVEGFGV